MGSGIFPSSSSSLSHSLWTLTGKHVCLGSIQLFAFYHSISGWNCIRVIDKQLNKQNMLLFMFDVDERLLLVYRLFCFRVLVALLFIPSFSLLIFLPSFVSLFALSCVVVRLILCSPVLWIGCYHRQQQTFPIAHMPHIVQTIHMHVKYGSILLIQKLWTRNSTSRASQRLRMFSQTRWGHSINGKNVSRRFSSKKQT